MFNDTSSTAALLATRRSGKARNMIAPGPDEAQLARILGAAIRVPDHGKLGPWRFIVVPQEKREAFAALLHDAARAALEGTKVPPPDAIDEFAHQAPCLIVALFAPVIDSHIPLWEQELSVGAACMNLLTAAHAEGFVGGWLTGWASYSEKVRGAFGGGENDRIAGFLFIGTPSRDLEERPRPKPETVISVWDG